MAVSSVRSYGSLASGQQQGDRGSQEGLMARSQEGLMARSQEGLMVGGTVTVRHKEDRQQEGQGTVYRTARGAHYR